MASEKFANKAATTLAANYTAGDGSISVASATGFPTAGVFRVVLGNTQKTIFRVDSVSGTTFTGVAEADDANASSGQTVTHVGTRGVAERFVQSPESGELVMPSGVAGADFYGPIWPLADPTAYSWAWVNQGGATVAEGSRRIFMTGVSDASRNERLRKKSHAASKKYTALFAMDLPSNNGSSVYAWCGMYFRKNSDGKLYGFRKFMGTDMNFAIQRLTNETTFSANVGTLIRQTGAFEHMWMQIEDDNANVYFRYSADGKNFVEIVSEGRTAFMSGGPDEVGFGIGSLGSPGVARLTLLSWAEA